MTSAAASREALIALKEDFGAWTTEPDLSRALVAQVDFAIRLLDAGNFDAVRTAIQVIVAGHKAAGPLSMGADLA